MITLLKILPEKWEKAKGYILLDLQAIEAALNQRWSATFGASNQLQPGAVAGDYTPATRYVANTGTDNLPTWDQVNLSNGVTSRLPFSNLVAATLPSVLIGRRSTSAGDFEQITLGNGLAMHGQQLDVDPGRIVGQFQMIMGEDGAEGEMGPPGAQGSAGAAGIQGPPGIDGEEGADGPMGPPGIQGATGATGAAGAAGAAGMQGPPGIDGESADDPGWPWFPSGAITNALTSLAPVIQTTTATGLNSDFALSGTTYTLLQCNNGAALSFDGFLRVGSANPVGGDRMVITVKGGFTVTIVNSGASVSTLRAQILVDSDGSGANLVIYDNGSVGLIYDGTSLRWRVEWVYTGSIKRIEPTTTGNIDNYDFYGADTIRWGNATTTTIRGLLAGYNGQMLVLYSIGAGNVVVNNQDANSSALNRIITITGANVTLTAGAGAMTLVYDANTGRWRQVNMIVQGTPVRGDVIVANSTPAWARLAAGAAKTVLRSDGTDTAFAAKGTLCSEFTTTSTGNIDDLDFSNADIIRMNNASDATIRGLLAGTAGQIVVIVSIGAGNVFLAHQNASDGTAANRLINYVTVGTTPLAAGSGTAIYQYDGTTARWRLISHTQGAFITPSFSAGDYTGGGSMTWTVDSADVDSFGYLVEGVILNMQFNLNNTTVGGTLGSDLNRVLPNSFQIAKNVATLYSFEDAGTTRGAGEVLFTTSANTTMTFRRAILSGGTNWSAATNSTSMRGMVKVQIT